MKCFQQKICILFFMLFFTPVAFAEQDLAAVEIRILPESIVYGDNYTLGDVAEFDGFDVEKIQRLAKVSLGRSPLPGKSILLRKAQIRSRIGSKFKFKTLQFILPQRALVSRSSIKVSKEEITTLVKEEILSHYQQYNDVTVNLRSAVRDIYLPKGELTYRIDSLGKRVQVGGYSSWTMKFFIDEKEIKKVWIRAKVRVVEDIVVAKGSIKKGTLIEEQHLSTVKKDISKSRRGTQTASKLVIGKAATREIFSNEQVNDQVVGAPQVVKKGNIIYLSYQIKNMILKTLVSAVKSGRIGDIIPVKNVNSKKIIYAKIVDAKNAEIIL